MKGYMTKEGNLSLAFHEKREFEQGLLHGNVNGVPLIIEQTLIRPILPWEQKRNLTMAQLAPVIIKEAKKAIKNNKEEWIKFEGFRMLYFEKRMIIVTR